MEEALRALGSALPALELAAGLTLACSIVAGLIALIIGIPAGLGRLSRAPLVRSVATFYVETVRGTPLLLQLLVWYFGVSLLALTLFNFRVDLLVYNVLTALNSNSLLPRFDQLGGAAIFFGVIGIGFNYGAYIAEVVRAGVQAVDQGETEAAASLGLSRFQTARYVVLPQALRIMTPALTNNLITLVQDTSFLQVLGVAELSLRVQNFTQATGNFAVRGTFYLVELAVYFVICYSLALTSQWMERRTAHTLSGAH